MSGIVKVGDQALPYRLPSLSRRIAVGVVLVVVAAFFLVVLPVIALQRLGSVGLSSGIPIGTLLLGGSAIAVLLGARHVAKPTRAFGPLSIATSLVGLLYLLALAPLAILSVSADQGAVAIGYGRLLQLLAIAPALGLLAGLVITIGDFVHPHQRLAFDFPP